MREDQTKLSVTLQPDKLAEMLQKRAEGHKRRVTELDERITVLRALAEDKARVIHTPKRPSWWGRLLRRDCYAETSTYEIATFVACTEAHSTADETKIVLARLAHAPVEKIGVVVQDTRDQRHKHEAALVWLSFTAENLTKEPVQLSASEQFITYVLDVDHPTAMPNFSFDRRGIQ